ncbi:MAG: hypothetical protein HYV06_08705 [Deltaproteobacteria bacterium]|nr:hypothetical protein [Deltaproteobacteria bacterium]
MSVNRDEFFREVTHRICSSLDIGVAVKRAFDYLREHFPLDEVYLDIVDVQLGAIRRIVHFAKGDGEGAEEIVTLPKQVWEWGRGLSGP